MPPVRRWWYGLFPKAAASRSTSRRTRDAFSVCPDAQGRALIDELIAHATQRQFVYITAGDARLVMWDDRCTMHHGTAFDDLRWKRDLQRATVCDLANSCEQERGTLAMA